MSTDRRDDNDWKDNHVEWIVDGVTYTTWVPDTDGEQINKRNRGEA